MRSLITISLTILLISFAGGFLIVLNEKIAAGVTFKDNDYTNYSVSFLINEIEKEMNELKTHKIAVICKNKQIDNNITDLFEIVSDPEIKDIYSLSSKNFLYYVKSFFNKQTKNIHIRLLPKKDKIRDIVHEMNKLTEIKPVNAEKTFFKGYTKLIKEKNGITINYDSSIDKIINQCNESCFIHKYSEVYLETQKYLREHIHLKN